MTTMLLLVLLPLFLQAANGAERKRLPNEIRPVSAGQSRTKDNNEAKYGAMRGIDGNQATAAYISKGSDRVAWYKVKFNGLQCIDQIKWLWGSSGSTVLTWNCNESGCGRCTGHSKCNDHSMKVIVRAEASSTNGLPPSLGCLYGDTFELQNNGDFWMYEIAFTGQPVKAEESCKEEKEELQKTLNENMALKDELKEGAGKLQEALNKNAELDSKAKEVEGKLEEADKYISELESKAKEVEGKLEEADKYISELKTELEQALADAEKKSCPGEGIWSVPSNVLGKKISGKVIKKWKKEGLKDNLKYLSSYKNMKITKDLARYIECFQTVN